MFAYATRRLLGLIPVLFGVSLLVFLIPRVVPGDPATIMLGERSSEANRARLRAELGLDRPLFLNLEGLAEEGLPGLFDSQYFDFMSSVLVLDFGRSIYSFIPVRDGLFQRFPATVELALMAMLFAVVFGVPLGVIAALRRGTITDTAVTIVALAGVSFPVFWLGIIFIYVFAVNLGWLPSSGRISVTSAVPGGTGFYVLDGLLHGRWGFVVDALRHLVMPAVAVGTIPLAIVVRMTRSAMLEVLSQDYIRTSRAKGLRRAPSPSSTPCATPCCRWSPSSASASARCCRARSSPRRCSRGPASAAGSTRPSPAATTRSSRAGSCSWRSCS